MKQSIALVFAVSAFFLAGCCAMPHATRWEYKVAGLPRSSFATANGPEELRTRQQSFLNDLGNEGWVLIQEDEGRVFYFKRPIN